MPQAIAPPKRRLRVRAFLQLRQARFRAMKTTPVTDQSITRQVQGRLASQGFNAPCRISVATRNGEVTLTGSVGRAQQKQTAVQSTRTISGVKNVLDQLIVKANSHT
jgi:osmotically-inducible protein OsmY